MEEFIYQGFNDIDKFVKSSTESRQLRIAFYLIIRIHDLSCKLHMHFPLTYYFNSYLINQVKKWEQIKPCPKQR